MRLLNILRYDALFQWRHRFYHAYFLLTILYVLALQHLDGAAARMAATLFLLSDTAPLGFFFIGGLILLEKGQRLHDGLFVTPLTVLEYLLSKVLSLSFVALLSALAILLAAFGGIQNAALFVPGFILSSAFYTLFGVLFAVHARHVNDYFAKALLAGLLLCVPVVGLFGIADHALFLLFPTKATILLIQLAFGEVNTGQQIYAFAAISLWLIAAGWAAYRGLWQHIILKVGTQ
ncbi:MAG: ABC transporter permease [Deferribacteres bacterium]|nr:ABC transporter permease [candidate division KSB1 bacterium]MCB9512159.1 ABC transporter permease [Deferribacteres bacterium]